MLNLRPYLVDPELRVGHSLAPTESEGGGCEQNTWQLAIGKVISSSRSLNSRRRSTRSVFLQTVKEHQSNTTVELTLEEGMLECSW